MLLCNFKEWVFSFGFVHPFPSTNAFTFVIVVELVYFTSVDSVTFHYYAQIWLLYSAVYSLKLLPTHVTFIIMI